jgi:hypothetical protein
MLGLFSDIIVALLLIATIGYSVVLNRRLTAVRSDRDKFELLVKNLSGASARAESAVANLRSTADELSRRLDKKVEEARALSDDLIYMIERGAGIADKLAAQIRTARDELRPDYHLDPRREARREHEIERASRAPAASHVAEPRSPEPRSAAPRSAELRSADARAAEAAIAEARATVARSAEPRPYTPPQATPAARSRSAFSRSEARPEPVRAEPIRVEPQVVPAAPTLAEPEPLPERADAPSRAERDLLRVLAARRR